MALSRGARRWSNARSRSSRALEERRRGHRTLGKRLWDEPVQRHLMDAGIDQPWYDATVDRSAWKSMEVAYGARLTWKTVTTMPARAAPGRFFALFGAME